MKTDKNINWVSIGEACRTIGVTEVTLRQWSDAGYIRTFVTPGGHRRYNMEELQAFVNTNGNSINLNDLSKCITSDINTHKTIGMNGVQSYENKSPFDDETLIKLKKIGTETLSLITDYLDNIHDYDKSESNAINIGYYYGELLKGSGLSVSEAVNSFLSHQDIVLSKAIKMLTPRERVADELLETIPNVSRLLSTVLSAMVEYYTNNK